jgi:hypothetical protein
MKKLSFFMMTVFLFSVVVAPQCLAKCDGDFDYDGYCDDSDLVVFAAEFGRTDCTTSRPCPGDFNADDDCDGSDLAVFAANFGRTNCLNYHEKTVIDFSTDAFYKIRNVVAPLDQTRPTMEFIGNHIKVQSEHWAYVLDNTGQQIFRPVATFPHIEPSFSNDIGPNLNRWMAQPFPQSKVDKAKNFAERFFGVRYNGDVAIDVTPARELIASKSASSDIVKHYEGRSMVLFSPQRPDSPMVGSYFTSTAQSLEGKTVTAVREIERPFRGYETGITFSPQIGIVPGEQVIRAESTFLTPTLQEIVGVFRDGLANGAIKSHVFYYGPDLRFGSFFGPDEWRFEYNAYTWESENFHYLDPYMSFTCNFDPHHYDPTCNPYYEDYYLFYPACLDVTSFDFSYYRTTPHYKNDFWYWWYYNGRKNGIRGNWLEASQSWEIADISVIHHKNLKSYNVEGTVNSYISWKHCDGVWTYNHPYNDFVPYKLEDKFYNDLEECHVATISTHGGMAFCFGFYQFLKERDLWVSLHRPGDDGLGKGNLRHLFLASCSSMNWNHGPKHGEQQNLFSDWMNSHVADGIRTVCGGDGELAGTHFTGLRFFKNYHLNESITQAWFDMQLEECTCNIPAVVAYGSTEDDAAATLFDGRFTKERGGTGWIIAAEVITKHLLTHQACCLPGGRCIDAASDDCLNPDYVKWYTGGDVDVAGTPMGSNTQCCIHCPEYYGYPLCF